MASAAWIWAAEVKVLSCRSVPKDFLWKKSKEKTFQNLSPFANLSLRALKPITPIEVQGKVFFWKLFQIYLKSFLFGKFLFGNFFHSHLFEFAHEVWRAEACRVLRGGHSSSVRPWSWAAFFRAELSWELGKLLTRRMYIGNVWVWPECWLRVFWTFFENFLLNTRLFVLSFLSRGTCF